MNFSKFHEFIFFKIEIQFDKQRFSYILHTKKWLYLTHILKSPPFHYNHGEVWFFAHKYIRNTMNIKYAKIKKNSRSRFFKRLPARASLRRLQGQFSVLPNLTNSPKIFHIIKDFNLNIKTIFKSTSFQNLLQLRVMRIMSKLKLEKKN